MKLFNISKHNGKTWQFWFQTDWQGYVTLCDSIGHMQGTRWKAELSN
jgi:hypothetical protein